jgi:hypothetical protein
MSLRIWLLKANFRALTGQDDSAYCNGGKLYPFFDNSIKKFLKPSNRVELLMKHCRNEND